MVRNLLPNFNRENGTRIGYECALDGGDRVGCRGVTVWGPASTFEIGPNGGNNPVTFNCTHPKCWQGKDVCNVYFKFQIEPSSSTRNDVGPLVLYVNGNDCGSKYYHSKIKGHDVTMAIDLGADQDPGVNYWYNDTGYNTVTFSNQDPQRTIKISNLRIIRAYGMCGLDKENAGCCVGYNPGGECWNTGDPCGAAFTAGTNGNLDSTRNDTPCNFEDHGGLSYTSFAISGENNDQSLYINPNSSFSWSFTAPSRTSGYIGPYSCLFNFNQIALDNTAPSDDVQFTISLKGNDIATYHHSRFNDHNIFPTVELCNFPSLYNDTGTNTVTLKNKSASVKLHLLDNGGVNVYRIYKTKQLGRNITASSDAHSSIDPPGSVFVLLNADQQFWMWAHEGYALNDVIVDGTDHKGPIPTYTFHSVTKDHTIDVNSCPHSNHTNNTPHTNYNYLDTAHSNYTYGDFSDVAHSDVEYEDAPTHSDVSHSNTSHSNAELHTNYVDWPYYQDGSGQQPGPYTDFDNHSNVSYSDTAHSDIGTGHSNFTDHTNYVDWPYYQDGSGQQPGPYTDFDNHANVPPQEHVDNPHSNEAHSDAGTYHDHDDTYPYPLPHVNYWGYPYSDVPHQNYTDHGNAGYTDHSDA
jgi:hypothetical protein